MKCAHCEVPITTRPRYTQQVGWARDRQSGGDNALKERRSTGKVLCNPCGDTLWFTGRHRNLIPAEQMTIE